MRTHKFKAWDGKRWSNEDLFLAADGTLWSRSNRVLSARHYNIVFSTFAKDEKGREIYEGDIVETSHGIFLIAWAETYSGMQFCEVKKDGEVANFYGGISEYCKVIGNIYENSDLLV